MRLTLTGEWVKTMPVKENGQACLINIIAASGGLRWPRTLTPTSWKQSLNHISRMGGNELEVYCIFIVNCLSKCMAKHI